MITKSNSHFSRSARWLMRMTWADSRTTVLQNLERLSLRAFSYSFEDRNHSYVLMRPLALIWEYSDARIHTWSTSRTRKLSQAWRWAVWFADSCNVERNWSTRPPSPAIVPEIHKTAKMRRLRYCVSAPGSIMKLYRAR